MISGYVVLTCKYHKEGKRWVADCDELGTSTFGRTLNEASERLAEAIELHLDTLEKCGEIERFFKENKIEFRTTKPKGNISISVPADSDQFVRHCIQPIRELTPA